MAEGRVKNTELSAIAAAIRSKSGSSDVYKPGEMAAAIEAIPTGTTPTGTVNITQNGTTDVTQYASASVNVPNSYSQSDEGKVVSNGELVAQTARSSAITENGTYDTTTNSSVTVNVSGGGGVISSGTAPPSSSEGADGDWYVQVYPLPSNVSFVEYLTNADQSDPTYLDTGITGDSSTSMYVKFRWKNESYVAGARSGATNRTLTITGISGTSFSCDRNSSRISVSASTASSTIGETLVFGESVVEVEIDRNILFINRKRFGGYAESSLSSFTTPSNLILFGARGPSSASNRSQEIYRAIIRSDRVVVADYLPALDGNGTPCMYETISGTFVYGTGAEGFVAGPAISSPEQAAPTVYLKQGGTWKVTG